MCLKAFDVRERFFHFEFFRQDETGDLLALEVNMRPPGGLTTDMFNYACDIDIYNAWASLIAGKGFPYPGYDSQVFLLLRQPQEQPAVSAQRAGDIIHVRRMCPPPRADQRHLQPGAGRLRLHRPLAGPGRDHQNGGIHSRLTEGFNADRISQMVQSHPGARHGIESLRLLRQAGAGLSCPGRQLS